MNILRVAACLLLCVSASLVHAQEKKKPLAIEDLYLMESVKSPALFPKEEKLVYERVWIDAKTKLERHSLWLVEGKRENKKPLEERELDGRNPVISPDGEWIAFLSTRSNSSSPFARNRPHVPPYSDVGVDVWLYHVKTGEVRDAVGPVGRWGRVFHDGFYGRVAFSPDSKRLVIVADDGKDPHTEGVDLGVGVVRPDQGEGYTGYWPAQIWIADIESRKLTRITNDDIWYGDPQWSPDGKSLVVVANKSKDRESVRYSINKNFDLYLIDVATKKQTQLTTNPGPDVSPRWSPDGKQIAYLSSPRNGPHRDVFDLGIVTLGNGVAKTRIVDSPEFGSSAFPLPHNSWDGSQKFNFVREIREDSDYFQLDTTTDKVRNISKQGLDDPEVPYLLKTHRQTRLSRGDGQDDILNSANRHLAFNESVTWFNEGFTIHGRLTRPRKEIAQPPYKLVVIPHGGPHSRSTLGIQFTSQLFAAHGYAVFEPNFRGSTGYGKKFLDANRLDLGGGDMRDILTGIDKLVKDGLVDPKRQFVYGISYGGFMTSWLVGQTHQFKAAVAQNAVTDMNMMYALSDLQSWTMWELGGLPWEQPERYRKHSPITYADKVKTPTLILHSRDDRRCPLPMGKAYHQALLANNVPTQMVIYPDEGHGIRQPRHREDVYRRVLEWFAKYDK